MHLVKNCAGRFLSIVRCPLSVGLRGRSSAYLLFSMKGLIGFVPQGGDKKPE